VSGASVLIPARDASRLQKAETELRTRPAAKVASIAVDVAAPETGSRIVDAAVAAFGALETLVNIFGIAALQSRRLAVNFTAITAIRQRHGDWANNMVPALRRTHPDFSSLSEEEVIARISAELTHVGRAGKPAEIAAIAAFLSSDRNGFVTGAAIEASGDADRFM